MKTYDSGAAAPRNPRKHRRLDDDPPDGGGGGDHLPNSGHPVEGASTQAPSYKESLMKDKSSSDHGFVDFFDDEDIDLHEGDVTRSLVDGLLSIEFSECVQSLAEKSLDQTLVIKLLGRRIGYTTLRTKIYELWKPKQAIRLMDIENDYFLVSFHARSDYLQALAGGPWTIFGHYLTVQQWISEFSTSAPYPTKVMVWIRLPGLPVTLYKRSIIEEIGASIGPVVKLDYQTESGRRGRFARMALSIDLSKPLISKLIVNGRVQLVEYESLPVICFQCGRYGHAKEGCPDLRHNQSPSATEPVLPSEAPSNIPTDSVSFGPWMVAARRTRKPSPNFSAAKVPNASSFGQVSRFQPIFVSDSDDVNVNHSIPHAPSHVSPLPTMVQKSMSTKSIAKKKSAALGKSSKAVTVKKPLMVNLSDFPALSRFSHKASTSKTLDKSKHSATVMKENDDPNIVDGSFIPPVLNTVSSSCPPLGDPPDTLTRERVAPDMSGQLDTGTREVEAVNIHDSGGSQEVAMIE
ncbi:hypothetical protein V6N11_000890 [Hibiscus sabdariffa]|uniref:CCHC-type domain-containing protein n=1 Tax=Hibiscus sabdariffa TaxID=183260 RepID=A0ABR2RY25_9ROSI